MTGFQPTYRSNIFQTKFLDHIWNPLIKANLLDPDMKVGLKSYFLDFPSIFKMLSLVRESKKNFEPGVNVTILERPGERRPPV